MIGEIGASAAPEIEASTARTVRIAGRELLYFGGCDYLGLAHHPAPIEAAHAALRTWGISAAASRRTSGTASAHTRLELDIARFLGMERAVLLPEGSLANTAAAQALALEGRTVLHDAACHPSILDALRAARLESIPYSHLDPAGAATFIARHPGRPLAIYTDGVFPLSGELAPLPDLLRMLPPDGVLAVDDCHGLGVLGSRGRGILEHFAIRDQRVRLVGTFAKALGAYGGFVAGPHAPLEALRAHATAYICSTPVPPMLAAAAAAALGVIDGEPARLDRLRRNTALLHDALRQAGFGGPAAFPVACVRFGAADSMRRAFQRLLDDGLYVPLIDYPGVAPGRQFRIAVNAEHTDADLARLADALGRHLPAA